MMRFALMRYKVRVAPRGLGKGSKVEPPAVVRGAAATFWGLLVYFTALYITVTV